MRRDGHGQDADDRQAARGERERLAETRDERVATREARELAVQRADAPLDVVLAAVRDELGRPAQQLDELGVQLARRRSPPSGGRTGERSGQHRDRDPRDEQPEGEHDGGLREERRRDADGRGADGERDERRPEAAEVEALQRLDVPDHPLEQVAAPVALELRGRERLEARVEARADPAQRAEREVVPDEPVEVARERAGEPEEAHRDDRDGEREDGRLLRRARDQVAGGRHQRDAERDGERAEEDREGCAPARDARDRDESPQGPHAASRAGSTMRPASRATIRSARRASSGRCTMSRTERPPRNRSTASPTSSALTGSRFAVGSSRMTSGASRRKARARASRCTWPAESGRPPSPTTVS